MSIEKAIEDILESASKYSRELSFNNPFIVESDNVYVGERFNESDSIEIKFKYKFDHRPILKDYENQLKDLIWRCNNLLDKYTETPFRFESDSLQPFIANKFMYIDGFIMEGKTQYTSTTINDWIHEPVELFRTKFNNNQIILDYPKLAGVFTFLHCISCLDSFSEEIPLHIERFPISSILMDNYTLKWVYSMLAYLYGCSEDEWCEVTLRLFINLNQKPAFKSFDRTFEMMCDPKGITQNAVNYYMAYAMCIDKLIYDKTMNIVNEIIDNRNNKVFNTLLSLILPYIPQLENQLLTIPKIITSGNCVKIYDKLKLNTWALNKFIIALNNNKPLNFTLPWIPEGQEIDTIIGSWADFEAFFEESTHGPYLKIEDQLIEIKYHANSIYMHISEYDRQMMWFQIPLRRKAMLDLTDIPIKYGPLNTCFYNKKPATWYTPKLLSLWDKWTKMVSVAPIRQIDKIFVIGSANKICDIENIDTLINYNSLKFATNNIEQDKTLISHASYSLILGDEESWAIGYALALNKPIITLNCTDPTLRSISMRNFYNIEKLLDFVDSH